MGDIITPQHVSTIDGAAILRIALAGCACTSVNKAEYSWHFGFGNGKAALNLECPWRLLTDDSIVYGCADHGQKFGLPEPVDGVALSRALLGSSLVSLVEIQHGSGDLAIEFANGVRLEVFNGSSSYEGWTCSGKGGLLVVAQGGGKPAIWNPTAVSEELR